MFETLNLLIDRPAVDPTFMPDRRRGESSLTGRAERSSNLLRLGLLSWALRFMEIML
jgi:hypothetical protein